MIELPEAAVLAKQLNDSIHGKRIHNVTAAYSPHKFAWYHGDPQQYNDLLKGKRIGRAASYGGMVEIKTEDSVILFGDGVNLRFHAGGGKRPDKHQLLIEFEDDSAISASVQMYGGLWCFREGEFENPYYWLARDKPSPLSDKFDRTTFDGILSATGAERLSAKALLATEQRIPGLGNGVLQDILFRANIHPKRKVHTYSESDREALYDSIKFTLAEMVLQGGRDTERDLFGYPGRYRTVLSKYTLDKPCPVCGTIIRKEAYLGGSIYFCSGCQTV